MSPLHWLIFAISSLAFTFDVYEIIVLPLILKPLLVELGPMRPGTPDFNRWVGLLIFVPAVGGGIVGLGGGYLTDQLGRRRVLFCSILLYAVGAVGAAYSGSLTELLIWRCLAVAGVSVEFVAGIAWLAELFPEPALREAVLGYSQAFSAAAGFILSGVYYLAVTYGTQLPGIRGQHSGWRYALLFGLSPAIPLIFVRPFLPESPIWRQGKQEGSLKRPSFGSLFHPDLRRATLVSTVMVACSYAAAFGAIQHIPRILPGLAEVHRLSPLRQEQIISTSHLYGDFGQLAGRLAFAVLASLMIRPRWLLYTFLLPCLVVFPFLFFYAGQRDLATLRWGYFTATAVMIAQLSYWGNYLPRLYPLHLRGTGESFAANIGGRLLGNGAAVLTTQLANVMPGVGASARLTEAAGLVGFSAYVIALAASLYLPAPRRDLTE
jgi:MFS family permease